MELNYLNIDGINPADIQLSDLCTSLIGSVAMRERFGEMSPDAFIFPDRFLTIVGEHYIDVAEDWSASIWRNTDEDRTWYSCLFCPGNNVIVAIRLLSSPSLDDWFDGLASVDPGSASYGIRIHQRGMRTETAKYSELYSNPLKLLKAVVPNSYRAEEYAAERHAFLETYTIVSSQRQQISLQRLAIYGLDCLPC